MIGPPEMENPPFIDDASIFRGCSIAMFDYQRVFIISSRVMVFASPWLFIFKE